MIVVFGTHAFDVLVLADLDGFLAGAASVLVLYAVAAVAGGEW